MGPLSYMRSVVHRNFIMRRIPVYVMNSGISRNFVRGGGGFQQIQLRTEDTENGDLGAVAP